LNDTGGLALLHKDATHAPCTEDTLDRVGGLVDNNFTVLLELGLGFISKGLSLRGLFLL